MNEQGPRGNTVTRELIAGCRKGHQLGTENFPRAEAITVGQHHSGLGQQVDFDGQVRIRYRRAMKPLEIAAHAKHSR